MRKILLKILKSDIEEDKILLQNSPIDKALEKAGYPELKSLSTRIINRDTKEIVHENTIEFLGMSLKILLMKWYLSNPESKIVIKPEDFEVQLELNI